MSTVLSTIIGSAIGSALGVTLLGVFVVFMRMRLDMQSVDDECPECEDAPENERYYTKEEVDAKLRVFYDHMNQNFTMKRSALRRLKKGK